MKFTVPRAEDRAQAESVWQATRDFLAPQGCGTEPDKIARIAVVGSPFSLRRPIG